MKFEQFSSTMIVNNPWDYDFYTMVWDDGRIKQSFLDYFTKDHGNTFMLHRLKGTVMFFLVTKGTILSEFFSSAVKVEDSPTEPYPEPEPDPNLVE